MTDFRTSYERVYPHLRSELLTALIGIEGDARLLDLPERLVEILTEFRSVLSILDYLRLVLKDTQELEQITIQEWLEKKNLAIYSRSVLDWFLIPPEVQLYKIWDDQAGSFWEGVLWLLDLWRSSVGAHFETVHCDLSDMYVTIEFSCYREKVNVAPSIPGLARVSWLLDTPASISQIPRPATDAALALAQLLATRGYGNLGANKSGDQIRFQLHIPRADNSVESNWEVHEPWWQETAVIYRLVADALSTIGNEIIEILNTEARVRNAVTSAAANDSARPELLLERSKKLAELQSMLQGLTTW